jgi:hypothetical protein
MASQIEYHKGVIGWAVLVNGKPVGCIRDQRGTASGGWYISVAGMAPNGIGKNEMHRRSLRAAKLAVENHFQNLPSAV